MEESKLLLLVVLAITSIVLCSDNNIEQRLQVINKPAIKTFRTKYGDVVDCVKINKQFAFDHSLLKNHSIQVNPTVFEQTGSRLFGYWTKDSGESTGCYNTLCPGFVQISKTIYLGSLLQPVSTYISNLYFDYHSTGPSLKELVAFIWRK
ncbi:unnamed protein product [Amaranthus hypochondriacus]